jgi:hypothetical protein
VADIVRRGVAEGQIRRDVPAEALASFLLGMLRTRARDLEDAPRPVRRLETLIELFCRGAGAGPPGAGGRSASRAGGRRGIRVQRLGGPRRRGAAGRERA